MVRKNQEIKSKLFIVVLLILGFFFISVIINKSKINITSELLFSEINFSSNDRILILAPHPDDEVLGTAGIIQKAKAMNLPVQICFLTYGDSNELSFMDYYHRPVVRQKTIEKLGLIRHDEAIKADKEFGVDQKDITFLGYPDAGTLNIWYSHWGNAVPYKSLLTKTKIVPYNNALSPGASYKGESIEKDLGQLIKDFQPTKIFVSHPSDQHPDHEALYLFTKVALWNLNKEIKTQTYTYLIHHTFKHWPIPQGYYPAIQLQQPVELSKIIAWQNYNLTDVEINRKFLALKDHKTQYDYDTKYLSSFIRKNELFGNFLEIQLPENKPQDIEPDNSGVFIWPFLTNFDRKIFGSPFWSVERQGNEIVFVAESNRLFFKYSDMDLNIFGYKKDNDFGAMPKIQVKINSSGYNLYDQQKTVNKNEIKVERTFQETTVRVPLDLLGDPDYILFSAESRKGKVILDRISWRALNL